MGDKKDKHAYVVQVAVGLNHGLLLTDEGIVYSWAGKNDAFALGRNPPNTEAERKPAPVTDTIRNEIIVQVACGLKHCLALSQSGKLFAWGTNKAGQLGLDGFDPNAKETDLVQKTPVLVWKFDGQNQDLLVKSCSCGPESSACVTTKGEIYVWGDTSFYLFDAGTRYEKKENLTIPAKLRNVPAMEHCLQPQDIVNDRMIVASTVAHCSVQEDLEQTISSLKQRQNMLQLKMRAQTSKAKQGGAEEEIELDEMKALRENFEAQIKDARQNLKKIAKDLAICESELSRIGRELTICNQQDTALGEQAGDLEIRKGLSGSHGGGQTGEGRKIDTELNDISHFKASNKRTKMQLLKLKDQYEQQQWTLIRERVTNETIDKQVNIRVALLRDLSSKDSANLGKSANTMVDHGIAICVGKHKELQATDPQKLSGHGSFSGFLEVMATSTKALQDVSSSLKEVSAAAPGEDGAQLEAVLEYNMKLRKDFNLLVEQKLKRAEVGSQGESDGMHFFHKEAQMPVARIPRSSSKKTKPSSRS